MKKLKELNKELKDKAKEKTEKVTKKIGESVKELQENFDEYKSKIIISSTDVEAQYSDEDKQKYLGNLNIIVVESEKVVKDWENEKSEAPKLIQELKDYRDNKPGIWKAYDSHTGGTATKALSNLKLGEAKTKEKKESTWGFKEKLQFQEFSFTKEKKEKEGVEESKEEVQISVSTIEVKEQKFIGKVEKETIKKEEKITEEVSKTSWSSFKGIKGVAEKGTRSIEKSAIVLQGSALEKFDETKGTISSEIEEKSELAIKKAKEAEEVAKKTETWKKMSEGWNWLREKMENHKIGDETNIKLKYRINEIQTKPEARLWLTHLLHPIHGERVRIEIEETLTLEEIRWWLEVEIEDLEKNLKILKKDLEIKSVAESSSLLSRMSEEKKKEITEKKEKIANLKKEIDQEETKLKEKKSELKKRIKGISLTSEESLLVEYGDGTHSIIDKDQIENFLNEINQIYVQKAKKLGKEIEEFKNIGTGNDETESEQKKLLDQQQIDNLEQNNEVYHKEIKEVIQKFILHRAIWLAKVEILLLEKKERKEIKDIKNSLDSKLAELVDEFIEVKKQSIKNKEDKQLRKEASELERQLEEKNLSEESTEKIIKCCKRLVNLEKQTEQQLQSQVEINTNK